MCNHTQCLCAFNYSWDLSKLNVGFKSSVFLIVLNFKLYDWNWCYVVHQSNKTNVNTIGGQFQAIHITNDLEKQHDAIFIINQKIKIKKKLAWSLVSDHLGLVKT